MYDNRNLNNVQEFDQLNNEYQEVNIFLYLFTGHAFLLSRLGGVKKSISLAFF